MAARPSGGATGSPAPTPGASFLRRHPILAAFGVLAGVSLFATYFPISAFVTVGLVAVRATGLDRLALRLGERGLAAVAGRWRARHAPPPSAPDPSPVAGRPAPEPPAPGPPAAGPPTPAPGVPRGAAHPALRPRRRPGRRVSEIEDRELAEL